MGTCWNCNTEISLEEERTHCDNCGEILFYHCNNCNQKFEVEDKKSKKKLEECKLCGFFKCPHCKVCFYGCKKYGWEREILKILRPEVTQGNCPNVLNKVRKIVEYIIEEKVSLDRKTCPERKVPITYAKTKIKGLVARQEGFRVKDKDDQEAFVKRIDELIILPIGSERTIKNIREKGSYGQEYRDAFNLLVCLGKLEIKTKKFKKDGKDIEYEIYVRCENGKCPKLDLKNIIVKQCENCKGKFPREQEYCTNCPPKKSGKNRGQSWKLKERLSDKDTCQLYRGSFDKKDNVIT